MLKTASSVINAIGALNYQGTWDASTNTPTLTSSVGTKGDYYVVSVAGNTNLNGITNWGIGDWAVFNGSTWQRVEGGSDGNFANLSVSNLTGYMYANGSNNVTASTTIPNAGLANNSVVIGNTTVSLGSTVATVGNLTLTGATVTGNVSLTNTTNANATFATSSLLLVPEGYVIVSIGGVNKKIPYYAV